MQDDVKLLRYRCPYTDRPCYNNSDYCQSCGEKILSVNAEICDNDCEHCEWATCPKMEGEDNADSD